MTCSFVINKTPSNSHLKRENTVQKPEVTVYLYLESHSSLWCLTSRMCLFYATAYSNSWVQRLYDIKDKWFWYRVCIWNIILRNYLSRIVGPSWSWSCGSFNYLCNQCLSPLGTPVSSTNKTDRLDITEILLKVRLNTLSKSRIWTM